MAKAPVEGREYVITIGEEELSDLKRRLRSSRWPDQLPGPAWRYGADRQYLEGLARYWQDDYSWRDQECKLNKLPHFKALIHGIDLHFLHSESCADGAIPLLFVHGWPGSFIEIAGLLPQLTGGDGGAQAFHVVAPSLPGYGFSSAPDEPGYGVREMAKTLDALMQQLGYMTYVAHGCDWGAAIVKCLACFYGERCRAIHGVPLAGPKLTNLHHLAGIINFAVPAFRHHPLFLSKQDMRGLQQTMKYFIRGSGYFLQQATCPQTLGYGLMDSPLGLLAWIVDKYYQWTDCKGDLESVISRDQLLTIVSIYWFSRNITASLRLYYEFMWTDGFLRMIYMPCKVPVGAITMAKDIVQVPKAWAEATYNVKRWTVFEEGGHFIALEKPPLLLEDLRQFFAEYH